MELRTAVDTPGAVQLRVLHETVYRHDWPVELAHHVAFLMPRDTPRQRLLDWQLQIDPLPESWAAASWEAARHTTADAWGNRRLVFSHSRVHAQLRVRASSRVQLAAAPSLRPALSPAWEQVAERLRYHAPGDQPAPPEAVEFSLASPFAAPDALLAAYARQAFQAGRPLAEAALALMQQIHADFRYQPSSTTVNTRASEALRLRHGVCQDFTQVLLAACRALGLSARYVSGYLLTQPPPGQPARIGADASHAWAEVWCPLHGWVGLDPTNAVVVDREHVLLAWGRDQADVAPLRGVIRGGGQAEPEVAVTVLSEAPAG